LIVLPFIRIVCRRSIRLCHKERKLFSPHLSAIGNISICILLRNPSLRDSHVPKQFVAHKSAASLRLGHCIERIDEQPTDIFVILETRRTAHHKRWPFSSSSSLALAELTDVDDASHSIGELGFGRRRARLWL